MRPSEEVAAIVAAVAMCMQRRGRRRRPPAATLHEWVRGTRLERAPGRARSGVRGGCRAGIGRRATRAEWPCRRGTRELITVGPDEVVVTFTSAAGEPSVTRVR